MSVRPTLGPTPFASPPWHPRTMAKHLAQRLALAVGVTLAAQGALLSGVSALRAQATQSVVAGTVMTAAGQRPLGDAQVTIDGTTLGGSTDAGGRFRIVGVTGPNVRITARRIGFQPMTVAARVGDTDVRIPMTERVLELNQIVVTGVAGIAEKRAVGNAVSTVRAADVVATQPVRNFQDLITGRASGVAVIASSGQVGTGARIRVRGASSLSLGNDPLIYVDGVRVDNAQATGPESQSFGSLSISRWNDFNPNDIESIEVIKGPAAATLYGTEASNGVIQIITKKGSAGRPVFSTTARFGLNWLPGGNAGYYVNYSPVPRLGGAASARDTVTITVPQLNDSLRAHFGHDIFRTGKVGNLEVSMSGGVSALRYYVGLGRAEDQGVERANRLQRTNVRANLTASPWRTVDVSSSMAYITGRTYLPFESGGGGTTWATFFSSPAFLYDGTTPNNPQLGFRSGPPDIYYQSYTLFQDANRFTTSVNVTNRPASWLDHHLILGLDRIDEDNQDQEPRNDVIGNTYASFSGLTGSDAGYLQVNTRGVQYVTADYGLNARYKVPFFSQWQGVTSAGGQFYGRRTRLRQSSAFGFPAAGILSLAAATSQSLDQDDLYDNNTLGGFVQEQLIWSDRLYITGAVRRDKNSAFGAQYPAVTYPKLSVSYVLSEERALHVPSLFNTVRVRGAYGGSGLQPGAFDAIRTYNASGGVLTPSNAGNPNLGPEKSYETEVGLDLGLADDRYGIEMTYFNGKTKDAILSRQAPPSAGFPGLQLFNAGRVDRAGLEWLLRAQPVKLANFGLDLTLSGSVTKYDIKSLGPGTNTVSLSSQLQHVVGYAPGAWWDRRVVAATLDPVTGTAAKSTLQCADRAGGTVACYNAAGTLVAPRVFLGNSVPTREGSFSAGLTFVKYVRLNGFVDYRGGYSKLDGNRRVRCHLFALCEENYYPLRFDPVQVAGAQSGTTFTYDLIRKADFVRFRELSLTYSLPRSLLTRLGGTGASITVAGRNLHLWTKYPGLEPEASFNGGTRGGAFGQWEQNVLPQTRSFVTTFNVAF